MTKLRLNPAIGSLRVVAFAPVCILLVILTYVWFISFGSWTNWPTRTTVYDQLATSFLQGKLSLEIIPDPALLALDDPYTPKERKGIEYPLDVSLYEGRYYYYFGPAPALPLMIPKMWVSLPIGDQYLAFIFISGILILQSLLILRFWDRFFKMMPAWIVSLCILFAGLASPFTWILSQASVYIVASAGGQFFFLLGLFFIINALDRQTISARWLFAGGISWAFALGSRLTQIVPIGFVALMVLFFIMREYRQTKLLSKTTYALAGLGLPLALGLGLLGWYNWARFDSLFETGMYYQLAGPNLQRNYGILFSAKYLLPNLYDYLLMHPKILSVFPYLQALPHAYGGIKFSFINLPRIYHEGELTGLLFTTPFALFAGLPVISLLARKKTSIDHNLQERSAFMYKWIVTNLLGSFLIGLATLAMFFWVLTRYTIDFIPPILLLSVLGFWQGYLSLIHKPIHHRLYLAVGIGLLVASIAISNLLALSSNAAQFINFDPGA